MALLSMGDDGEISDTCWNSINVSPANVFSLIMFSVKQVGQPGFTLLYLLQSEFVIR